MGITPGQKCNFKIPRVVKSMACPGQCHFHFCSPSGALPLSHPLREPCEMPLVMIKTPVQNSGKCTLSIILVISHSTPVSTVYLPRCRWHRQHSERWFTQTHAVHPSLSLHLHNMWIDCKINSICGPNPNAKVSWPRLIISLQKFFKTTAWEMNSSRISPCMKEIH